MTTLEKIYQHFLAARQTVSTDSRKIEQGCIFFALKGENFNGNRYASDAIKSGAAYAVIDEEEFASTERTILVNDVLTTLQQLALFHRKKLGIPILGITGTNGKTTTKELIAAVLAEKYKVSFTQGNLNNHIGVPLTLLKMDNNTEFGVVEMGANHPGEIAELCQIADPDFGIITNVGKAHLEGFGSFEGVIKTKGELYDYMAKKSGVIFYNRNNNYLEELGKNIPNRVSYGTTDAGFKGELLDSPPFVHLKVNFAKGVLYLNTKLIGNFNFENVLAAACIGNYFEVDPLKIQSAIKNYEPRNNRSQLIVKNDLRIIMDAYNANPTSMKASLDSFAANTPDSAYLILGDMLELGEYSFEEHLSILKTIREKAFQNVFLVGKEFTRANENFDFRCFEKVEDLCLLLEKEPIKNGNVLIKGSRGIKLEKVLEYLN
ncbi:UDP-N-acetylmuramoyl-tripeptide--D-alanyl-D-alanine ligase [Maribellus sp. CM-23]|uniref:UDP-N-acetylmuramoyl-tripeptide--D-alanyl-D- alanine ligase n=1 Tax=Maribellus sp. CM-23 TaxID=2781026 RepID=UPI001F1CB17A|nr:UDP-N-acetylmuramoyl-tripeptide--D-alanyl-D-alanine ligase [Maribellus sp. CM-23]MCE4563393.1 UDP-N-acetylmuramoyl-tripeptide--D-alanyl-D-alanine ligase [Maribellus sp. CM-23]